MKVPKKCLQYMFPNTKSFHEFSHWLRSYTIVDVGDKSFLEVKWNILGWILLLIELPVQIAYMLIWNGLSSYKKIFRLIGELKNRGYRTYIRPGTLLHTWKDGHNEVQNTNQ